MGQTSVLPFLSVAGPKMKPVDVHKTELPDGTCILRGRVRRSRAGEMRVDFQHYFADTENVVVLVNGNFNRQVGFIETVTEIEADHFMVTSDNEHHSMSFVSWVAFGKLDHSVEWIAVGN